jgi:hypothetical protein
MKNEQNGCVNHEPCSQFSYDFLDNVMRLKNYVAGCSKNSVVKPLFRCSGNRTEIIMLCFCQNFMLIVYWSNCPIGIAEMKRADTMNNQWSWDKGICARWSTVQHQTKLFYFVALKFAGLPDNHILTGYQYNDIMAFI